MIEYKKGDILAEDVEALVDTVNCAGIMGRSVALQFRNAWPGNLKACAAACRRDEVASDPSRCRPWVQASVGSIGRRCASVLRRRWAVWLTYASSCSNPQVCRHGAWVSVTLDIRAALADGLTDQMAPDCDRELSDAEVRASRPRE
jgi:hypothetical protein